MGLLLTLLKSSGFAIAVQNQSSCWSFASGDCAEQRLLLFSPVPSAAALLCASLLIIFRGCARCGQRLQQLGLYRRSDSPLVGPISTSCIIIYMYICTTASLLFHLPQLPWTKSNAFGTQRSWLLGRARLGDRGAGNASIQGGMQLGSCPEIMGTWSFYLLCWVLETRSKAKIDPNRP